MRCLVAAVCLVVLAASPATADPEPETTATYLTDGGALPFVWLPLAGTLALDPDLLSRWDTRSVIATGGGVGLAAGMFATSDGSAPFHAKGLVESAVTSATLTGAFDALVGKRTGGSSGVFAVSTYGALYLRGHVLRNTRPAWQIAAYSAIGLSAIAIASERALHDGGDWTDVAIGGLIGTASSTLFYLYQEHRFAKHNEASLRLAPTFSQGVPALSFVGRF